MLGGRWRVVPPQVLDQPSSGNGGPRVQDQVGEQCPLFRPAQPQDPCSVRDLDRPEDAELEVTSPSHGSKLAPAGDSCQGALRCGETASYLHFEQSATALRPGSSKLRLV